MGLHSLINSKTHRLLFGSIRTLLDFGRNLALLVNLLLHSKGITDSAPNAVMAKSSGIRAFFGLLLPVTKYSHKPEVISGMLQGKVFVQGSKLKNPNIESNIEFSGFVVILQ